MKPASEEKVEVALIGVGTVESVPIYHYHPGGTAVRVRLPLYADKIYACDSEFDICTFTKPGSFDPMVLDVGFLLRVIMSFKPSIVVFEGYRVEKNVPYSLVSGIKGKTSVAFRVIPINLDSGLASMADVIVVDYPRDYLVDPSLNIDFVKGLERALDLGLWTELNVYLREPSKSSILPAVEAIGTRENVVLHVHLAHHKGGGPVRELVEMLRQRVRHVYVHNDMYPYKDTLCPSCGAHIATRRGVVLDRLVAPGGRCWRCGSVIPFHGIIRDRTPRSLLYVTGGMRWIHPRLLRTNY